MIALALAVALTASPEVQPDFRLTVGGQLGLPQVLGATAIGSFLHQGKRRFDVDALWEPSLAMQSYSVGAAYHVLDSAFFVGARVRVVQFIPSWQRGGGDAWLGLGLEAGGRFQVAHGKGLVQVALFGTWVPAQVAQLQSMVGLSAGFSWTVFER